MSAEDVYFKKHVAQLSTPQLNVLFIKRLQTFLDDIIEATKTSRFSEREVSLKKFVTLICYMMNNVASDFEKSSDAEALFTFYKIFLQKTMLALSQSEVEALGRLKVQLDPVLEAWQDHVKREKQENVAPSAASGTSQTSSEEVSIKV